MRSNLCAELEGTSDFFYFSNYLVIMSSKKDYQYWMHNNEYNLEIWRVSICSVHGIINWNCRCKEPCKFYSFTSKRKE